ncbi:epsin-3-like [Zingiber officinale]|uniref:epsin-3-like n=1 Tax=Zingiber officinale TaxID=94328 RepID=UPI001C4CF96D|nr:epsin-3-like [Zingiber officinale]
MDAAPFFHELRKQASFFLKDKLRTARLALTDVTPAQLLTEEATNSSSWAPDSKTMRCISLAAFEIDDYWRIVEILHKKFEKFDKKQWREPYKALILLEYLLTHGPKSIAEEFQNDKGAIQLLGDLKFIDERGFNWGLTVKYKTQRVLNLLDNGQHLDEERDRARKLSRGIQGFGSFNLNQLSSASDHESVPSKHRRHDDDVFMKSEKENLKCDATVEPLMRREGRIEGRLFQELSNRKILAVNETRNGVATKPTLANG